MELSRKNLIYRFVNLYTEPNENFCIFARQFFIGILGILIIIAGTAGTFTFVYFNVNAVSGFLYFLKFFSVISTLIISVLVVMCVLFLVLYVLSEGKNKVEETEFYKGMLSKMTPIKNKYSKLCCKIKFKD